MQASSKAKVYTIPAKEIGGELMPEFQRVVFDDLVKAEQHLVLMLEAKIDAPQGRPWLCVLPTGQSSFFPDMDIAEDFAIDAGFGLGHFVIHYVSEAD